MLAKAMPEMGPATGLSQKFMSEILDINPNFRPRSRPSASVIIEAA